MKDLLVHNKSKGQVNNPVALSLDIKGENLMNLHTIYKYNSVETLRRKIIFL